MHMYVNSVIDPLAARREPMTAYLFVRSENKSNRRPGILHVSARFMCSDVDVARLARHLFVSDHHLGPSPNLSHSVHGYLGLLSDSKFRSCTLR